MAQMADQLAGIGRLQLDAWLKAAELGAESAQKLGDIGIEAAKESYAEAVEALKKAQATRGLSELAGVDSTSLQPLWEKTTRYSKSVYAILSTTHAEYAYLLEQQLAELNKGMVVALETAAKSAPAGSESVINVVKSSMHSANAWYETVAKTARQIIAATEASFSAAADQVSAGVTKKAA